MNHYEYASFLMTALAVNASCDIDMWQCFGTWESVKHSLMARWCPVYLGKAEQF